MSYPYHWEIKKARENISLKILPAVWHDDSLLFWNTREEMYKWAEENKYSLVRERLSLSEISKLIFTIKTQHNEHDKKMHGKSSRRSTRKR